MAATDYASALASLFEAKLTLSSSHLEIRAPQNRIAGAMMSMVAQKLETITTAKTQALAPHLQAEALRQGIRIKITQTAEHWPGGLADSAWRGRVSELCVLGLSPNSAEPRLYYEDWLFGSGRPCILYPDDTKHRPRSESPAIRRPAGRAGDNLYKTDVAINAMLGRRRRDGSVGLDKIFDAVVHFVW